MTFILKDEGKLDNYTPCECYCREPFIREGETKCLLCGGERKIKLEEKKKKGGKKK